MTRLGSEKSAEQMRNVGLTLGGEGRGKCATWLLFQDLEIG